MKVQIAIHDAEIIDTKGGTQVCTELKTAIEMVLEPLPEIRGADVVNIEFHQSGRGQHPRDQAIGTPLFAMLVSLRRDKEVRHLPLVGGQYLPITFFRMHNGKGCIVPHVAGAQKYEGEIEALIPGFAQTVLHVLTTEP